MIDITMDTDRMVRVTTIHGLIKTELLCILFDLHSTLTHENEWIEPDTEACRWRNRAGGKPGSKFEGLRSR